MREPNADRIRDLSARLIQPLGHEEQDAVGAAHSRNSGMACDPFATGQGFDVFFRGPHLKSTSWVMFWSDLMMTMFIMFAALYAFQVPKDRPLIFRDKPVVSTDQFVISPTPGMPTDATLLGMFDELRDVISHEQAGDFVSVDMAPDRSLHVVVRAGTVFQPGRLTLTPRGREVLLRLGERMLTATYYMAVAGHAAPGESLPEAVGPWAVASGRATTVADLLLSVCKLPAERMSVVGFGDKRPARSADPLQSVSLSPRVEIVLMADNPAEPVQRVPAAEPDGFMNWLGGSKGGVR